MKPTTTARKKNSGLKPRGPTTASQKTRGLKPRGTRILLKNPAGPAGFAGFNPAGFYSGPTSYTVFVKGAHTRICALQHKIRGKWKTRRMHQSKRDAQRNLSKRICVEKVMEIDHFY